MASADEIYITVKGKGGHAAEPGNVINPIFIAARLLVEIEKLINELSKAKVPTVLAFGKISGAGATNVIPSEVTIDGTLRTMDEQWRNEVHERIKKVVTAFSTLHSHDILLRIAPGYPVLVNDEVVTSYCRKFAEEYLGKENIADLDIRMASEDFSYYSQEIPACFYRIGTGNAGKGIISSVHTPTFDIDEDALEIASGMMAWIGFKHLQEI